MDKFLDIVVIDIPLVYLEGWSLVHFISGFIIMWLILRFNIHKRIKLDKYALLLLLLFAYEVFEFDLIGRGLVRKEIFLDFFWDLIIGVVGGFVFAYIRNLWFKKRKKLRKNRRKDSKGEDL